MTDMNKVSKNLLTLLAVIALACWAGQYDYTDQVVPAMGEEVYDAIKSEMPHASDNEIAQEYMTDKAYWDALVLDSEYR